MTEDKKLYTAEGFNFEFAPEGSPFAGQLSVTGGAQTFVGAVKLDKIGSRRSWASEASKLYPDSFEEQALKRALNEVSILRAEEVAAAAAKAEEEQEEATPAPVDDEEAEKLISDPGVLDRYVEAMANIHEVHRDREQMKVVTLGAASAQLAPLPGGRPLGTNAMITGESGRGKNYIADAAASGLPDEMVYRFESASAKSFYYEAQQNPSRFSYCWVYPNEAEATDHLVETLRPMLSGGKAEHKTVNKGADGTNEFQTLRIEGPMTVTIPTVRNKLDGQLLTRMLVIELEDFEGRVGAHSEKVSDTLLPDYAAKDHGTTLELWKAAFRKLTTIRRVVIPQKHEGFKFTDGEVSHGARLWRNFLSLMLTNAWLEQRNRGRIKLANNEEAIVASSEDYRIAYEVFKEACRRSVVNLGDRHRAILNAVYELQEEDATPFNNGYSLRKIGEKAGCSHQAVKNNKAFLVQSVGLLREVEGGGLRLINDAEPSWWEEGKILEGFPSPDKVKQWWADGPEDDGPGTGCRSDSEKGLQGLQEDSAADKTDAYEENSVNGESLHRLDSVNPSDSPLYNVNPSSTSGVYAEFSLDKPESSVSGGVSTLSTPSEGRNDTPCIHEFPGGKGCFICDPEHPKRKGR